MRADGAADRTRGRRRVCVVLPTQGSALSFALVIYRLGMSPVAESRFGFGHPIEVDVVAGVRIAGRLHLILLGKVDLQVDSHLI